jgi:hypothetical protein
LDAITWEDSDVVHPHLARDMGQNLVPIFQLYPEHGIWQRLDNPALQDDRIFLGLRQDDPPSLSSRGS